MAMKKTKVAPPTVQLRNPLAGLWRIAVYYVVLFLVAWLLSRFPLFGKVVFGRLGGLFDPPDPNATPVPFQDVVLGTPGAEIGLRISLCARFVSHGVCIRGV